MDGSYLYSPKHCDPLLLPDDDLLMTNVWPRANLIAVEDKDDDEILEPPAVVDIDDDDTEDFSADGDTLDLKDTVDGEAKDVVDDDEAVGLDDDGNTLVSL